MAYDKTWAKEFAEGYDEVNTSQRYQRAKYIVDEGIEAGHNISEISRATEQYGDHKLSQQAVATYIDLYAVSEGATRPTGSPISSGERRLSAAMKMYDAPVEEHEIEEYVAETGADEAVARRMIRGKKIGEALAEDDLINEDGTLDVPDPRKLDGRKLKSYKEHGEWMGRFGAKYIRTLDFIQWLKDAKQDDIRDSSVAGKLRGLAGQFEKQATRFEVGYSKMRAKKDAAERAKT
jgi:hypothetical protein